MKRTWFRRFVVFLRTVRYASSAEVEWAILRREWEAQWIYRKGRP